MCAFYQKYGAFWGKKFVRLFVRFLAKLGALLKSKHLEALLDSNVGEGCLRKGVEKPVDWDYGKTPETIFT